MGVALPKQTQEYQLPESGRSRPTLPAAIQPHDQALQPSSQDTWIIRHALATGMSAQQVVYPGVRRSCFMAQALLSPSNPALAISTVPRPYR